MTAPENEPSPHRIDSKTSDRCTKWGEDGDSFQQRRLMMRLASAGFELATFSLILGGLGYAIDQWAGNQTPYIAIVGLLVGFSLGFYRLIVLANQLS